MWSSHTPTYEKYVCVYKQKAMYTHTHKYINNMAKKKEQKHEESTIT